MITVGGKVRVGVGVGVRDRRGVAESLKPACAHGGFSLNAAYR